MLAPPFRLIHAISVPAESSLFGPQTCPHVQIYTHLHLSRFHHLFLSLFWWNKKGDTLPLWDRATISQVLRKSVWERLYLYQFVSTLYRYSGNDWHMILYVYIYICIYVYIYLVGIYIYVSYIDIH